MVPELRTAIAYCRSRGWRAKRFASKDRYRSNKRKATQMRRQGEKETRVFPPKSSRVAGEEIEPAPDSIRGGGMLEVVIGDRFYYLGILLLIGFLLGVSK